MGSKFKPNKRKTNDGLGMTPKTNGQKALGAETALMSYAKLKSIAEIEDYHISDFLADIRHLCHRDGRDFEEILADARKHYIAER